MGKKDFKKRFTDQACRRWEKKIRRLADLESKIQAQVMEFTAETGVRILDIQIYDPGTGEIQFETDI